MSFDVLMQNFYKISQGNEKVPSFVTKLEGTLNQIQNQMPQQNSRLQGARSPQRLTIPQS